MTFIQGALIQGVLIQGGVDPSFFKIYLGIYFSLGVYLSFKSVDVCY